MGMFSHSYVIADTNIEDLLNYYRTEGTQAYIYPAEHNAFNICDDNDDEPDLELLLELTGKLHTVAFLGQVFDSSVFAGTIFNSGEAIDEYIDYHDLLEGLASGSSILNLHRLITVEQRAAEWTNLFHAPQQEKALRDIFNRRADFFFSEDFHISLLQTLLLPDAMIGQEFTQIERAYNTYPETRKVLRYTHEVK